MSPRRITIEQSKGVFEVEWPLFGELSRALALKVVRSYDPEIIVGIATAGVVPGAVIAAILDREFHSIVVSRRYQTERSGTRPRSSARCPRRCAAAASSWWTRPATRATRCGWR